MFLFCFLFVLDLKMSTRCLDLITESIYVRNFTCRLILLITISFQVYIFYFTCILFSYTKKSVLEYKMSLSSIFYCIVSTNYYYKYVNDVLGIWSTCTCIWKSLLCNKNITISNTVVDKGIITNKLTVTVTSLSTKTIGSYHHRG